LPFVYDAAPSKQGKFMPGSHIPIRSPDDLSLDSPDCLMILPWNLQNELLLILEAIYPSGNVFVSVPKLDRIR
jgi:hypothetical protein